MQHHHPSPIDSLSLCDLTRQAVIWARQAGELALYRFKNVTATRKADDTLQTQVDLDIEQFLITHIRLTYPDHAILAEEGIMPPATLPPPSLPPSTSSGRSLQGGGVKASPPVGGNEGGRVSHEPSAPSPNPPIPQSPPYTWAIDPLDGTTAFVRGLPGWGISMALLYEGRPLFGLFHMPLLDDLTYSCLGRPFGFCRGRSMPGCETPTPEPSCPHPRVLGRAVQPDWSHNGFLAVTAGAHKEFRIDIDRTRALGSVAASLVYTARGAATAAFIPKAYLWDLAAGALILQQAGGELRYLSGPPVDLAELLDGRLIPEPIVAGHPDIVAQLQHTIQRRHRARGDER